MKRVLHSAALALGLLLGASLAQADVCGSVPGNLVSNCGFETGDFTGWTLSGLDTPGGLDSLYGVEMGTDPDGINPNSGNYQAWILEGTGAVQTSGNPLTLSQTLSTIAGQTYLVSLHVAQDTPPATYKNFFDVSFGGLALPEVKQVPEEGYTDYSFFVTATSSSSVLSLTFGNDDGEFLLDDVSVTVPEPGTPAIVAAGLFAMGWIRRRQRGARKQDR